MQNCIFCSIIGGGAPAQVVYEDEWVLGITPTGIISTGHSLLLPKTHFRDLFDINEETMGHLSVAAKRLSVYLVDQNGATGINLLHASGQDAQQSVFHFHLHLVPRYPNDGLDLWLRQGM